MSADRIFNFTNTYEKSDYPGFEYLDCTGISGTDMYCDDEARKQLKKLISEAGATGLHLIDSGNYHYMTRIFTELIEEDYVLVYFDNHTDMKPAMFDMLSCGSWAKEALLKDEHLKKIVMIGPPEKSVSELPDEIRENEKLFILNGNQDLSTGDPVFQKVQYFIDLQDLPVYLSIDKDVLDISEVHTNWDQGCMELKTLLTVIKKICDGRRLLGADICGLFPYSAGDSEAAAAYEKGVFTDGEIINTIRGVM